MLCLSLVFIKLQNREPPCEMYTFKVFKLNVVDCLIFKGIARISFILMTIYEVYFWESNNFELVLNFVTSIDSFDRNTFWRCSGTMHIIVNILTTGI